MRLNWPTILATAAVAYGVAILAGVAVVYSGGYDISANEEHWPITRWVMETARVRSIKVHAQGIKVPSGLEDPARLAMGVEHFAAHCAVCHGAPGVPKGEIAEGLYPQPPNLAMASKLYSDAELFWILKHGIKMTGMPSWSDHRDEELWATVGFIKKLPSISQQDYAKLVMASGVHGDHSHSGESGEMPAALPLMDHHEHQH